MARVWMRCRRTPHSLSIVLCYERAGIPRKYVGRCLAWLTRFAVDGWKDEWKCREIGIRIASRSFLVGGSERGTEGCSRKA